MEQEHGTLIFSDLNRAKYSDYLAGDFISVDVKSEICRLKNICEIKDVANAMKEIAEFVEKEV